MELLLRISFEGMMSVKGVKERVAAAAGSVSGAASVLGSWQVCHNLCLAIIVVLGVVGITLTGMPLLFFTKVAIPLWILALILFALVFYFYVKRHCISRNLLMVNAGLIIAGVPFQVLEPYRLVFWLLGALPLVSGIGLYVKERFGKKKCSGCN